MKLCLDTQIGLLSDKPHPNASMANQGMTLADWARWMRDNGNYGTLAKVIRRYIQK